MSVVAVGRSDWKLTRDDDGYKDYDVEFQIETDDAADGPEVVLNAPGLPSVGTSYAFGNDANPWAFAYPRTNISRVSKLATHRKLWTLPQRYSTRPLERCQTTVIGNPLLEPAVVSGSFKTTRKLATEDRNGSPLVNSAGERIVGPDVEMDLHKPTVIIEQNQVALNLDLVTGLAGWVNDAPLWGLLKRQVKLVAASWRKLYYGVCNAYYRWRYEFELDPSGFHQRKILDEGDMCFAGTDKNNPTHYVRCKDNHGEIVRLPLDGLGGVLTDITKPFFHYFELEDEANLIQLGIPLTF